MGSTSGKCEWEALQEYRDETTKSTKQETKTDPSRETSDEAAIAPEDLADYRELHKKLSEKLLEFDLDPMNEDDFIRIIISPPPPGSLPDNAFDPFGFKEGQQVAVCIFDVDLEADNHDVIEGVNRLYPVSEQLTVLDIQKFNMRNNVPEGTMQQMTIMRPWGPVT